VLPFENRSREEDDAYFVDGIHDDILTQLSKVSALRVISRTSVERFRDSELSLQQIAQQLGVRSILEGGVQRAGDRVRINVQLIDATTDAHLWAETYDRELIAANVFAIQSELALAIAGVLKTTLTPAEQARTQTVPTRNLQAWEAYQLGRQRMARRTVAGLVDAVTYFEKAIALDPAFALAYVALADTFLLQVEYAGADAAGAAAQAQQLVQKALRLDPDLTEAIVSSAMVAWMLRDFRMAEAEFKRALAANPNSEWANHWYSGMLKDMGRTMEARPYAQRAVQLDPLSPHQRTAFGSTLIDLGEFRAGLAQLRKAVEIDPTRPAAYIFISTAEAYARGRVDEGVLWIKRATELDPEQANNYAVLSALYFDLGDEASGDRALRQAIQLDAGMLWPRYVSSVIALYRGQAISALEEAKRALQIWPQNTLMLAIVRNEALERGDFAGARTTYDHAYPELMATGVDANNYLAAIDLALVLQRNGDRNKADRLLAESEAEIRGRVRLGVWGYGLADVKIHALRSEKREALAALRAAVAERWRGPQWRYYRDFDPALASIRNEPEFKAVFADIERDTARQRAALAARPKDAPLDLAATGT
jgi:TolB-like protein